MFALVPRYLLAETPAPPTLQEAACLHRHVDELGRSRIRCGACESLEPMDLLFLSMAAALRAASEVSCSPHQWEVVYAADVPPCHVAPTGRAGVVQFARLCQVRYEPIRRDDPHRPGGDPVIGCAVATMGRIARWRDAGDAEWASSLAAGLIGTMVCSTCEAGVDWCDQFVNYCTAYPEFARQIPDWPSELTAYLGRHFSGPDAANTHDVPFPTTPPPGYCPLIVTTTTAAPKSSTPTAPQE